MRKYALKSETISTSDELFVGIDAAKSRLAVAVVRRSGTELEVVLTRSIANNRAEVEAFLAGLRGARVYAVYEAGPTGYPLLRWLRGCGVEAFMTPPSLVPVTAGDRVKTDKRDAVKLAKLLAGGQLRRVQDLTDERYADREVVRVRDRSSRARTQSLQQLKSLILVHGIDVPLPKSGISAKRLRELEAYPGGTPELRNALKASVSRFRAAKAEVRRATEFVEQLAEHPRYKTELELLRSIPGIGIISGITILVERGNRTFASAADFTSYCGLTPSEFSTGDARRQGRITRQGNARLRAVLVEAAWRWVRGDAVAAEQYEALKARQRCGKKAVVAMARRLATVIHAILRDQAPNHRAKKSLTLANAA